MSFAQTITRSVWVEIIAGAVLQIVTVAINLFGLSMLRTGQEGGTVASAFALIFAAGVLAAYATGFLSNYASAKVDIDLRARLMEIPGIPASRANNDVTLAVGVIGFYVFVPGQTFASLIYLIQLYRLDPVSSVLVIGGVALAAAPLLVYVRWRGRMIGRVRSARNMLLDGHAAPLSDRLARLGTYRQCYLRFVVIDATLGLLFMLTMIALVFVASGLVADRDALAALVLIVLILLQVRNLATAASLFQENRKSAAAVARDLAGPHRPPQ
ncbi:hypothetical protein [uncultured Roseobacter sp.]|uniref:hypothetical protein n=1 Tax=uncultured Roseobacter sp. TaxID=114847 RepID=UPI002627CDB2|nr:hypothetical protein [uncultured Roseobacter sp.]